MADALDGVWYEIGRLTYADMLDFAQELQNAALARGSAVYGAADQWCSIIEAARCEHVYGGVAGDVLDDDLATEETTMPKPTKPCDKPEPRPLNSPDSGGNGQTNPPPPPKPREPEG